MTNKFTAENLTLANTLLTEYSKQTFVPETYYDPELDVEEEATRVFTAKEFEDMAVVIFGNILPEKHIRETYNDIHDELQMGFERRVDEITDVVMDEILKVMFIDHVTVYMRDKGTTLDETLRALDRTKEEYDVAKAVYDKRTAQYREYRRKQ